MIAAFLRDSVVCVVQLLTFQSILDALLYSLVAIAVIYDCVSLRAIDELLDVLLSSASDNDEWVDIGLRSELEDVGSDC